MTLTQNAKGGAGNVNSKIPSVGGDATSSFSIINTRESAIIGTSNATGGLGGTGFHGGNAMAAIALTDVGNVTASATSLGGNGGGVCLGFTGGNGGAASLGTVFGTSTNGGTVGVTASATGGNGGSARWAPQVTVAAVRLTDLVAGDTTGALTLHQLATGGAGGVTSQGTKGSGGDAGSSLTFSNLHASACTIDVKAIAGQGLMGGNATAAINASGAGILTVTSEADGGGNADNFFSAAAIPGSGLADSYASTTSLTPGGSSMKAKASTASGVVSAVTATASGPIISNVGGHVEAFTDAGHRPRAASLANGIHAAAFAEALSQMALAPVMFLER